MKKWPKKQDVTNRACLIVIDEKYCQSLMRDFNEYGLEAMQTFELEILELYFIRKARIETADMFYKEILNRKDAIPYRRKVSECLFYCTHNMAQDLLDQKIPYRDLQPRQKRIINEYQKMKRFLNRMDEQMKKSEQSQSKSYNPYTKNKNY